MQSIKNRIKTWKFWQPFLGALLGTILGYLYYYFIGCSTNSCPITSNPYASVFLGTIAGFILAK